MSLEHYAKEADRLLSDDTLTQAFDKVRADALEALATADVKEPTAILLFQAKVAVIEEIRSELRSAIMRLPDQETATPYA
jgi:hypothetical protein